MAPHVFLTRIATPPDPLLELQVLELVHEKTRKSLAISCKKQILYRLSQCSVTIQTLMRKRDFKNYSTYTLRVNIHEHDFDTVETDQNFWPNGVYWQQSYCQ
jgi:hypothetical protein